MSRRAGTIVTVVVAVLTLCCSTTCCASGAVMAASGGQWLDDFYVAGYYGVPLICLGALVWVVPVLLWLFLVRGKKEAAL